MNTGIWVRLMHRNKIEKDVVEKCVFEDWQEALNEACRKLDVPRPLILSRHERDWDQFSQCRFLQEHFLEEISFDRMEVEFIDPDKKKSFQEKYI